MKKKVNVLGHELSIKPKGAAEQQQEASSSSTGQEIDVSKAAGILIKYKEGKKVLEERILENEKWYRLQHWEVIKGSKEGALVQSKSAWLFNSIMNKHGDIMDNFPSPNILPRERDDVKEAENLSKILPLVLEHNDFEETYSNASWYKVKHGSPCYGVFWDKDLDNGLGDIVIKNIDLLNVFWEPGITNIQDSANLFIVELVDNDLLTLQNPQIKAKGGNVIDVAKYSYDDNLDVSDKSVVVDWYYKTANSQGKQVLHYVKFTGSTVLYATETDANFADVGLYEHGEYPIFIDVLFPVVGSPTGFGFIDIMKDPQMYIDKLDSLIMQNAFMTGNPRWFARESLGINTDEFADFSNTFVGFEGGRPDEDLIPIKVETIPTFIIEHAQRKIDEIKEVSGNRDFSQGGTSGGVTAAAAIAALQEAGNKLSRDMIKGSYRTYSKIIFMCIELIRQFYDTTRQFRITGEDGNVDFIDYKNTNLAPQPKAPLYEGADLEPGYQQSFRQPIFDIKVKAEKSNPFSRMAQNELAKELYGMGIFNPTQADQAMMALDMMDFEGKQSIVDKVAKNQQMLMQIQALQEALTQLTGADVGAMMGQQGATGATGAIGGKTVPGQLQATTNYAQRTAENAQVHAK